MENEQKGFVPKTEEDIKSEVIEDLKGDAEEIDLEANADLIERITQRRLKDEEFKASVHAQKIERGEKAKQLEEEISKLKSTGSKSPLDETRIKDLVKELREEETLEELEMSPEIKEQIKTLSALKKVSVKKASEDPYIQSLIKAEKDLRKTEDASLTNSNKGRARIDFTKRKMSDFDLTKPDDLNAWENLSVDDKNKIIENSK